MSLWPACSPAQRGVMPWYACVQEVERQRARAIKVRVGRLGVSHRFAHSWTRLDPPLQAERKNDALVEQLEGLEAAHQRAVDLQEAAKLDRDQLIKKVQQMEKLVYVTDGRITPHHRCTLTRLGVRMLEQLWTAAGNRQATRGTHACHLRHHLACWLTLVCARRRDDRPSCASCRGTAWNLRRRAPFGVRRRPSACRLRLCQRRLAWAARMELAHRREGRVMQRGHARRGVCGLKARLRCHSGARQGWSRRPVGYCAR